MLEIIVVAGPDQQPKKRTYVRPAVLTGFVKDTCLFGHTRNFESLLDDVVDVDLEGGKGIVCRNPDCGIVDIVVEW